MLLSEYLWIYWYGVMDVYMEQCLLCGIWILIFLILLLEDNQNLSLGVFDESILYTYVYPWLPNWIILYLSAFLREKMLVGAISIFLGRSIMHSTNWENCTKIEVYWWWFTLWEEPRIYSRSSMVVVGWLVKTGWSFERIARRLQVDGTKLVLNWQRIYTSHKQLAC